MVGGDHGAVPVQADEAQRDNGCGAEHDIEGDPDFAEQLPKEPHPRHLVNDAGRENGWKSELGGLFEQPLQVYEARLGEQPGLVRAGPAQGWNKMIFKFPSNPNHSVPISL